MANDFLGLYLDLKARRQQEEQFRASMEARQQEATMRGFGQALEAAQAFGDPKLALKYLSLATDDRDTVEMRDLVQGIAKQAKQRLATPSAGVQTELSKGLAADVGGAADPRLAALAQFRGEEQLRGQGIPESAAAQIGMRAQALAGEQARGQRQFEQREQFKAGTQFAGAAARQQLRGADTIYSVRDQATGQKDTIIGLEALRAARVANPGLLVTGKPTAVGTEEEVFGRPTRTRVAQLQDDAMHLDQAATDIDEAIGYITENPALAGFVGTATRAVGGGWQTLQELSGVPIANSITELADSTADKIAADVDAGRMDAKAARDLTNALTDPRAPALDVLGAAITYGYARSLRGEGKLTVDDKERAENAVGVRTGVLTSSKQVLERLKFARKRIARQQEIATKRLEFGRSKEPAGGEVGTFTPLETPPPGGFDIDLMGGQ